MKTNEQIRTAFDSGKNTLLLKLEQAEADIKNSIEIHEKTGDELLLAIDCPAEKIKNLTTEIEETHPIGRLFDIDVIDTDGQKLSRRFLPQMYHLWLSGAGMCTHKKPHCRRDAGKD